MTKFFCRLLLSVSLIGSAAFTAPPSSLATVPTFTGSFVTNGNQYSYTMAGRQPQSGGTTTIPTVLVPIILSFQARGGLGGPHAAMDAAANVPEVLHSPIFQRYPFATGNTQYADAVQRAQFYSIAAKNDWHTMLGEPHVAPAISIEIPAASGYLLHSQRTGKSLGIADLGFVQQELFQDLAKTGAGPGTLLIALTRDVLFYSLGDATVCCSAGMHGVEVNSTGRSAQAFVIASYFDPGVVPDYADIQAVTQQIGEWVNDPLAGYRTNKFPAWLKPNGAGCGGGGESSAYIFQQPADYLSRAGAAVVRVKGKIQHLENIALLPWFEQEPATETFQRAYSFPNTKALAKPAEACTAARNHPAEPTAKPVARTEAPNGHALIGYWEGYSSVKHPTPIRDVSPQWDVVIATFAAPVKGSKSLLHFEAPAALGDKRFKEGVDYLKSKGKKVLISLGGGGQVVTLNTPKDLHNFVSSVTAIVEKYGFDGVDLDIETPSLILNPGDTDFRHPTTPSVVNLITAMHQLKKHFGSKFMITEVPEGPQTQAGMQTYAGQFGSFLPVIYGTRDILSFVDVQHYNTPPLEGLDGNYYFAGTADYNVALSEMMVHGFPVAGAAKRFFPALPAEKVAVGFAVSPGIRGYTSLQEIEDGLRYLMLGKPYTGAEYKLRWPAGYPQFLGTMFWAINADRRVNYKMSNAIGPFLHKLPR